MTDKEKKKPRMTCKKYCPVWNDIDKDCEIYGEHHFTPRTCPHYNIYISEKKKMAEMFNKIIEENYDTQNTKNEQQKDLCITSEQLTEQFDNDEITKGNYYCKSKLDGHECIAGFVSNKGLFDCDYNGTLNKGYWEVLAPVPSYEEWEQLQNWADFTNNYHELREKLEIAEYENAQFKELLKECKPYIALYTESNKHIGFTPEIANLLQRINEVLK